MRRIAGSALVIVLALTFVLLAFGGLLRVMTGGAAREVGVITGHLRAVAVGEAAFSEIVARLSGDGWAQRWFAGGPYTESDLPAAGGRYSYLIREVPADPLDANSGGRRADLLIRAAFDASTATMFWRLALADNALDSLQRVIPIIFTFAPDDTAVSPGGADVIGAMVDAMIAKRRQNRPAVDAARRNLPGARAAPEVGTAIGTAPAAPPLDTIQPLAGGPPVASGGRIAERQAGLPGTGLPPPPAVPADLPIPGAGTWPGWPPPPPLPPEPPTPPPATTTPTPPPTTGMSASVPPATPPPTASGPPPPGYSNVPFDQSVLSELARLRAWMRKASGIIKSNRAANAAVADKLDAMCAQMESTIPGNPPDPPRTLSDRELAAMEAARDAVEEAKALPAGQGPIAFPPGP